MAAPALAAIPIPKIPKNNICMGTMPGVDNNMPTKAVKMIKATTLGLQSSKYFLASITERANNVCSDIVLPPAISKRHSLIYL
jgi:hypothetical protein